MSRADCPGAAHVQVNKTVCFTQHADHMHHCVVASKAIGLLQGLLAGHTVAGVAGGVNAMMLPITTCTICGLGALSPSARCKTFDASADGYGRGEAFAVAVLGLPTDPASSDASIAQDDSNSSRMAQSGPAAIILGSAVNQDGRSSGLTAPNGPSQTTLISDVLLASDVAKEQLQFLAVHGTGTPLGDPIEVSALGAAWGSRQRVPRRQMPVGVMGSVKSVYGHTEGAAGMTGDKQPLFPDANWKRTVHVRQSWCTCQILHQPMHLDTSKCLLGICQGLTDGKAALSAASFKVVVVASFSQACFAYQMSLA